MPTASASDSESRSRLSQIPRRVVVDEGVSRESPVVQKFRRLQIAPEPTEWIFVAEKHRGIPDDLILSRLLGADSVLLTTDRVLHNRARRQGLVSYTINESGDLTKRPIITVPIPNRPSAPISAKTALRSDYLHPVNALATRLKRGLDERDLKRYRTRRRRIRSYFGGEHNIAKVSVTVGQAVSGGGLICGFFLALAGSSGLKGIRASEGYAVAEGPHLDDDCVNAACLLHALQDVYLLQLEALPVELFIIPEPVGIMAHQLLAEPGSAAGSAREALSMLLRGLINLEIFPCAKGRFHDAMMHKLHELARRPCNELVPVDFRATVDDLLRP